MFERLLARWRGVLISLVGVVATLWLAATGQLGLYIHPRYFEFTVVMAVLAGVAVIAACAILPLRDRQPGDHEHSEDEEPARGRWSGVLATGAGVAAIAGVLILLLIAPPSALTTAAVTQDALNAAPVLTADDVRPALNAGDGSQFTVKDWATLLRQGADDSVLGTKRVDVTGFVTADADDPDNVFYVARYVITCCAVDAQPVGVPVYEPGWRSKVEEDAWVRVTGAFRADPRGSAAQPYVIRPESLTPIDEPSQPYVY